MPIGFRQGANQALEDVHMLSLLQGNFEDDKIKWKAALEWWRHVRQERVGKLIEIANEIRRRRDPGWTGEGASTIDTRWLFDVDIPNMVRSWKLGET